MDTTFTTYNDPGLVLPHSQQNPYTGSAAASIPAPDTSTWYSRRSACLRTDPTLIASRHIFPDAQLPIGMPPSIGAPAKICVGYRNAWSLETVADPAETVNVEKDHPTFAFHVGAPTTPYQIDVESQLRRLDQPLTNCHAVLAEDSPLYRNTVAPPPAGDIPKGVQNAGNPISSIIRSGGDTCRMEADTVASAMSGRAFHNPTRQDTQRFAMPFSPPGVGTGAARPFPSPAQGKPYYS